jgi:hypothetical protein
VTISVRIKQVGVAKEVCEKNYFSSRSNSISAFCPTEKNDIQNIIDFLHCNSRIIRVSTPRQSTQHFWIILLWERPLNMLPNH